MGKPGVTSLLTTLVEDGDASVMIDTGLVGEPFFVRRLVRRLKLKPSSIRAILLTHGHLDHAGNLAWLKSWTGARVFAHPAEQAHVDGTYPYTGKARQCGKAAPPESTTHRAGSL